MKQIKENDEFVYSRTSNQKYDNLLLNYYTYIRQEYLNVLNKFYMNLRYIYLILLYKVCYLRELVNYRKNNLKFIGKISMTENNKYYVILDLMVNELEFFQHFQMFLKFSRLSKRNHLILKPKFDELCVEITSDNIYEYWNDPCVPIYIHRFMYVNEIKQFMQLDDSIRHKFLELFEEISEKYSLFISSDNIVNVCLKLTSVYDKESYSWFGDEIVEDNIILILSEEDKLKLISYEWIYRILENYKVEYIYRYDNTRVYIEYYNFQFPDNYIQLCDIAPGVNYETLPK